MKYRTFLNVIKKNCSFLEEDGYMLREISRNVYYEKQTSTEGFCIGFSCSQYNSLLVYALRVHKRFNSVEELIYKLVGYELNESYTISEGLNDAFWESSVPAGIKGIKYDFEISEEKDIDLFIKVFQNFYTKVALPFFEEYKTVKDIENWMAHVPMEKHQDKLISWSNTMMLRKLIILKQASSEEFASLYPRYKEFLLNKKAEGIRSFVEEYDVFEKLIPYFESE